MALDKAREIDADLAMACDPDGDRIGIAVKDDAGRVDATQRQPDQHYFYLEYIIQQQESIEA